MSAEMYEHDHMVSALITPWHGLGTVSDRLLTPSEAFVAAKIDFEVGKHPAFTRVREDANFKDVLAALVAENARKPELTFAELLVEIGFDIPIEDKFATVRHDVNYPLGVVGNDYTVFANSAAREIVEATGMPIETAGSLNNGRRIYALAKLDRALDLQGDQILPYLLFLWSHDGTSAVRVMPTPVRVVCANTLRMALAGAQNVWSASHTASIHDRAEQAKQNLRLTNSFYDKFEDEVRRLIDLTVSEMTFESILQEVVPDPVPDREGNKISERKLDNALTKRGEIRKLYHHDDRVAPFQGTGWGVMQAFSTHDLWYGKVHGGDAKRLERQATRVLGGDTLTNTTKVQGLLAALAA
jgi:phage/plasmid-like protein (TIGR03299 family)